MNRSDIMEGNKTREIRRMADKYSAQKKYRTEKAFSFSVQLLRGRDDDVIETLSSAPRKADFIRKVIRAYNNNTVDIPEEEPTDYELRRIENEIP